MTTTNSQYIPGICNINPAEIKKRRTIGHIGLVISVLAIASLTLIHAEWYYRLVVFIPVFLATTGYLQARNKFCVGFAGAGQQHADDGEVVTIKEETALKADKLRARTMNSQVFLVAALVTIVFAALPL